MKIILNIEKRHLIFFGLFLVLIGGVFVIANPQYPAKVGHQELQVDTIYPFNSDEGRINIPGRLRVGGSSSGNYWTVGIKGPVHIHDGELRVEKLCDAPRHCIDVKDLIDNLEEGGNSGGGSSPSGNVIYGDSTYLDGSLSRPCKESGNENYKEITIPNSQLNNKNKIRLEATGIFSHQNNHIYLSLLLKKEDGNVIKTYPIEELGMRIGDHDDDTCRTMGVPCSLSKEIDKRDFIDNLGNDDLTIKFIACGGHEGGSKKELGTFTKDSITATPI